MINCRVYFLFNIFLMTFLYFALVTLAPNFEDYITLSSFGKTIENLLSILESENEIAITI